jgi:hypothetical protein
MKDTEEKEQILAHFGVSLVEYEAMICPYYGDACEPRKMASRTVLENNCSRECQADAFSADDYLLAIEGMIAKGWLCLQKEQKPRKQVKPSESGIPQREQYPIEPGSVVFTKTGYLLHRRLLQELHGQQFMQKADSFTTLNENNCEIHFFAATKSLCEQWIHDMSQVSLKLQNLGDYVNSPVDFVSAEGPVAIGKWRPSPHLVLSKGYHAVVRYCKHESLPFNVQELNLEAEIDSFQPVSIHGKICDDRFSFGDDPAWDCHDDAKKTDDSCAEYHWDFTVDGPTGIETPAKAHFTGGTYSGGFSTRNILFQLREPYSEPRKKTLTVDEAKSIVRDCAMKYLQHIKSS